MRRAAGTIAALWLLASAGAASAADPGCRPRWTVRAYRATGASIQPAHPGTHPVACGIRTGHATSETTIAVARGALLFSPAGSENTLARSVDRGRNWGLVGPTELQYTSLWNTVDPQVVVDPRTGRAFWIHTTYSEDLRWPLPDQSPSSWLVPTIVADAHGFQVFRSSDGGRAWRTADYRTENTADWEKLFVGPPRPRQSGAPQPSGYPDVVYMCANAPAEVTGPGRGCYRSLDGGVTFTSLGFLTPSASAPPYCPPLAANTGAAGPDGTVYIPQSCAGGTYVAVSRDEGATFTWVQVPGAPSDTGLGAVAQLAVDASGNLYVLWLSSDTLELARSRDGGRSWSAPLDVSPPGLHGITLPALAAGTRGRIGIVFYASTDPSAKVLSGYLAETGGALGNDPLFYVGAANDPAHPIFDNYGQGTSPRADFIGAAFDGRGVLWGGLVQQLGSPNSSSEVPTTGYVAHLEFAPPRLTRRAAPHRHAPAR